MAEASRPGPVEVRDLTMRPCSSAKIGGVRGGPGSTSGCRRRVTTTSPAGGEPLELAVRRRRCRYRRKRMSSALWNLRSGCPNRIPSTRCCTGVTQRRGEAAWTVFLDQAFPFRERSYPIWERSTSSDHGSEPSATSNSSPRRQRVLASSSSSTCPAPSSIGSDLVEHLPAAAPPPRARQACR